MIERAPFGATGHDSSRAIFGAAALGRVSKGDADRALELLLEHGVNHIDVAASYGDAELRIATWLRRNPGTFFVATKTGERTYRAAREEIRRSLDRLGVDRVDSIQLHNLVDVIEWETALAADGALEAAIEAREEGLVRFIGVTGHGLSAPEMHRRSLERFAFDSVLLPYNYVQMQDPRYADRFETLAAQCAQRNIALQTIKSIALRRWDGRSATASTWYEPLREQADIDLAAHWVLGRPDTFLLTTGDVEILPRLLDAVERFDQRPTDEEMAELSARREISALSCSGARSQRLVRTVLGFRNSARLPGRVLTTAPVDELTRIARDSQEAVTTVLTAWTETAECYAKNFDAGQLPAPHLLAGRGRRRGRPRCHRDAGEQPRTSRVGAGPSLRRLQLLLVPARPGRQLLGVLQRHRLHRRRPSVEARGVERMHGLYKWGPPPPSFLAPEDLAGLMAGPHGSS